MIAENIVDEQQHVGAHLVAEIFGHRDAGMRDAEAHARRFVHLAEHERGLRDDARLFHFVIEVVAFARALADAGEHGEAIVDRATLRISSWISTVLPTPAPPNNPTLPPS